MRVIYRERLPATRQPVGREVEGQPSSAGIEESRETPLRRQGSSSFHHMMDKGCVAGRATCTASYEHQRRTSVLD